MEWQPIETAPKDGTDVLVFADSRVRIARWERDQFAKTPRPYWSWSYDFKTRQRENQPRVWRPLPAPPNAGNNLRESRRDERQVD